MYDKERLGKIIGDIEMFMNDLKSLNIKSASDLNEKTLFYSSSMLVFSIINRTIDLGEEIVSNNKIGTPSTYKDIFYLLCKGKLINGDMRNSLTELISFRNLFSHEYYTFKQDDVFGAIQKIGIVENFMRRIKSKINK